METKKARGYLSRYRKHQKLQHRLAKKLALLAPLQEKVKRAHDDLVCRWATLTGTEQGRVNAVLQEGMTRGQDE